MLLPKIVHDLEYDHLLHLSKPLGTKGRLFIFITHHGSFKNPLSKPVPVEAVNGIAIRLEMKSKPKVSGLS